MTEATTRVPSAFPRPGGRPIYGCVDLPPEGGPRPTVVVCHGFKGFMSWGFFPYLAELLAERGFTVVRFNFSGAGMKPGDELVTDPTAFRNNTFDREREDLLAVLGALGETVAPGRVDPLRIGLFGHSRGGAAALLAAASDVWKDRIKALVTWAAIGTIERFDAATRETWRRQGEIPVVNSRTGQQLHLGPDLLAEMEAKPPELDLLAAAGRRWAPWLIVHGDADESVPEAEGEALAAAATPRKELLVISGGNHTFGARHPFVGPTPELIRAMNATQTWFRRHLIGAEEPLGAPS